MNEAIHVKSEVLRALGTKEIVNLVEQLEKELGKLLKAEAKFKAENAGYLTFFGSDCQMVKQMLAELSAQVPAKVSDKKLTVGERETWLILQRTENKALATAVSKQLDIAWQLENMRIDIEMSKRRLDSLKQVLNLKIAQIEFLAG